MSGICGFSWWCPHSTVPRRLLAVCALPFPAATPNEISIIVQSLCPMIVRIAEAGSRPLVQCNVAD